MTIDIRIIVTIIYLLVNYFSLKFADDTGYIPDLAPDEERNNLLTEHLEKHKAINEEKAKSLKAKLVLKDDNTDFEFELNNGLTPVPF